MTSTQSRLLNHEDLIQKNIFTHPTADKLNFTNATINLTIGKIISLGDYKEVELYSIPPRGMALVITEEIMEIPNGVIGYTTVKNGLSLRGIMAVNIGIVDNGWNGPISSILINFGSKDFELKTNDVFLRMTFHEYEIPQKEAKSKTLNSYTKGQYTSLRKDGARAYLSDTFLVMDQVKNKIRKDVILSIWKIIKNSGLIATLLVAIISMAVYIFRGANDAYDTNKISKKAEINFNRIDSTLNASQKKISDLHFENQQLLNLLKKHLRQDSLKRLSKQD